MHTQLHLQADHGVSSFKHEEIKITRTLLPEHQTRLLRRKQRIPDFARIASLAPQTIAALRAAGINLDAQLLLSDLKYVWEGIV